jgi:hypothetical protein
MNDADIELRNMTYQMFADLGRAPRSAEVAVKRAGNAVDTVAGWRRLHDAHALVLHADTGEIRMANPFAAEPTKHRVQCANRWWFANCAWDAFGVCAALHADGRIETSCADCGASITVEVRGGKCTPDDSVFHCLVPAAQWWNDIGFT